MSDESAEPVHCHGQDRLCTCPCVLEDGFRSSPARDERGRICADCQAFEAQEKAQQDYEKVQAECVCSWNEFSGRSVCGLPCPVHVRSGL